MWLLFIKAHTPVAPRRGVEGERIHEHERVKKKRGSGVANAVFFWWRGHDAKTPGDRRGLLKLLGVC